MSLKNTRDQNIWNFIFAALFLILFFLAGWWIERHLGYLPHTIPLLDLFLIIFAAFRAIRLFTYDRITQFVRDWFVRRRLVLLADGTEIVERMPYDRGPLRTLHNLLTCLWCMGVWNTFVLTFLYFLFPLAWYGILILAVAGIASLFQVIANSVGWVSELKKEEVRYRSM